MLSIKTTIKTEDDRNGVIEIAIHNERGARPSWTQRVEFSAFRPDLPQREVAHQLARAYINGIHDGWIGMRNSMQFEAGLADFERALRNDPTWNR